MRRIVSIQYLRAIAAILVVIFHYANTFREKFVPEFFSFDIGAYGVDIFFVISGYIMYSISAVRSPTPIGFMKDRIARIAPLYWVLTLIAAFVSTTGGLSIGLDASLNDLIKSLLFIPEWNAKYPTLVAPVLLVGWTLNLEMAFYVIFAVSLLFARRTGMVLVLLALLAMGTAQFWLGPSSGPLAALYTKTIVLEFGAGILIGMVFADARVQHWVCDRAMQARVLALCLAVGSIAWLFLPDAVFSTRAVEWGIPASMLVAAALLAEPDLARMRIRLFEFLGDASYSIYLVHLMAMPLVYKLIGEGAAQTAPALALIAQMVCAVALGAVVYLLIEQPLAQMVKGRRPFVRVFSRL